MPLQGTYIFSSDHYPLSESMTTPRRKKKEKKKKRILANMAPPSALYLDSIPLVFNVLGLGPSGASKLCHNVNPTLIASTAGNAH